MAVANTMARAAGEGLKLRRSEPQSITEESQGRNLGAGAEAEATEESQGRNLGAGAEAEAMEGIPALLHKFTEPAFFYHPGLPVQGCHWQQ